MLSDNTQFRFLILEGDIGPSICLGLSEVIYIYEIDDNVCKIIFT